MSAVVAVVGEPDRNSMLQVSSLSLLKVSVSDGRTGSVEHYL